MPGLPRYRPNCFHGLHTYQPSAHWNVQLFAGVPGKADGVLAGKFRQKTRQLRMNRQRQRVAVQSRSNAPGQVQGTPAVSADKQRDHGLQVTLAQPAGVACDPGICATKGMTPQSRVKGQQFRRAQADCAFTFAGQVRPVAGKFALDIVHLFRCGAERRARASRTRGL